MSKAVLITGGAGFIFTSTNKVYGELSDLTLCKVAERYEPDDPALRMRGISEERPLESTHLTAAPKARRINTCSTMRAPLGCLRRCSA